MPDDELEHFLREQASLPVAASITTIVSAAKARHGAAVAAVLFYGSCLRLESDEGKVVDLYVVIDDYKTGHHSWLAAFLNWTLPPNVYYLEVPFEGRRVRAKYAVVSQTDFAKGAGGRWFHPYLWARFAQPCRLVYCRDEATRDTVITTLGKAIRKSVAEGLELMKRDFSSRDLWVAVFSETYRTELRAEPPGRAAELYSANQRHFDRASALALKALGLSSAEVASQGAGGAEDRWQKNDSGAANPWPKWLMRRLQGKLLSVLRLIKAAFTFQDGAQYLLWKIERHSGVSLTLTPWQRRHPVLASTVLFWRLYRKGAFR